MPVSKPESSDARIIAHVDMDCFYVQVEQRKQPDLRGLPTAVVQYNSWKGGALIAVSYEARKYGVKRSMRGNEAKQVCPQIKLVQVPVSRDKADLNTYRNAGSEVVSILATKGRCERASIDEVYLDLTDAAETMLAETPPESLEEIYEEALKSHVLGLNNEGESDAKQNVRGWLCRSDADHRDKLLACGALIVAELRMQVLKETEFTCSAGIAHNKMLAKLASAMNKPAQQTVVPFSSVKRLLESLPIKKMKQLGGKLGTSLQIDLGVNTVGDLLKFSEEKLQDHYGINTGTWLWNIARGISGEEVEGRLLPKSHGSGKTFPGPRALKTIASVQNWLNKLCEELDERLCSDLDQNKRIAKTLTLHARAYISTDPDSHKFPSKSCPLRYGTAKIQEDALNLFQTALREFMGSFRAKTEGSQCNGWGITGLSVSASKIVSIPSGTCSITKYFQGKHPSSSLSKQSCDKFIQEDVPFSPSGSESYSGLNSNEPQIVFPGEEISIDYAVPSLAQQEEGKDPSCSSPKQGQDGYTKENSLFCLSGSERCSGLNQSEPAKEITGDEPRTKHTTPSLELPKQERNMLKDKLKERSILRFFKSSSKTLEHVEIVQDAEASSSSGFQSTGDNCSELNQNEQPKCPLVETMSNGGGFSSGQDEQRRERWSYKIDEIDPSVVDELPPEIQSEIQAWLRPLKQPNTVKRGSSIAHYFLPAKNK